MSKDDFVGDDLKLPSGADELVPPWERFPEYERHTIGWRMGEGEGYLGEWNSFVDSLPQDYYVRIGYFKRHRPAPLNWSFNIWDVLHPEMKLDWRDGCSQDELELLLSLGLIEHDAAFGTWLLKQRQIVMPWGLLKHDSAPIKVARYHVREFWFCSRQIQAARLAGRLNIPAVPEGWRDVEEELMTGCLGTTDVRQGLLTLAKALCAGTVPPPWTFGLRRTDFADSFDADMGYADAYRLWMMCAFDDDELLRQIVAETHVPAEWKPWIDEQASYS